MNTNEQDRTNAMGVSNTAQGVPSLALSLTLDVVKRSETGDMGGLTGRQLQLLSLAAQGLTNQQIADDLGIAGSTVANTLVHVYEKIGVANRVLAVRWLVRQVGEEA